jgi:hypothetical protein
VIDVAKLIAKISDLKKASDKCITDGTPHKIKDYKYQVGYGHGVQAVADALEKLMDDEE